jgi:hemerythrin superfamily protein
MMSPSGDLPARGATAIEMILVNDHQIIKSLLSQLVNAADGSRKDTFDRLKSVLTVHNATEENLVYPALAIVAGEKSESQHLFHETAEADTLMFELDMMLKESDDARFAAGADKLQKAVLEHIDAEENTAFPHLHKHVDAAQEQQLTDDVRDFRNAIRFQTKTA